MDPKVAAPRPRRSRTRDREATDRGFGQVGWVREDKAVTGTERRPRGAVAVPVEVTLAVGGMTCGAGAARIERRLNRMDGVSARVNLASERAAVVIDGPVPVDRIIDEVAAAIGLDGVTQTIATVILVGRPAAPGHERG